MKVINLDRKKTTLAQVLKMAGEENLILKTSEGKEFVLAEADDFSREISLVRENVPLMALLTKRSKEKKKYSIDQVRKILKIGRDEE
jgi:hypothetical protein